MTDLTCEQHAGLILVFEHKSGQDDTGGSGAYVLDPRTINGKTLYINAAKSLFLFYWGLNSNNHWAIASMEYLGSVLSGGGFWGIAISTSPDPSLGWKSYVVAMEDMYAGA